MRAEPATATRRRGRPAAIADHALLSNCQGSSLVTRDGTIDWACLPRFDGPALFASILDVDAGHWSLAPHAGGTAARRYLPGTMVLCTEWRTDDGCVEVWDLLPLGEDERGHHIGQHAPAGIIRVVVGIEGTVEMGSDLALRPEYGLVHPQFSEGEGCIRARGGADADLAIVGFLPADDPRMRSTVEVISEQLTDDHGFVYRYIGQDDLDADEGTFSLCTFWLAHCWALFGEVDRARALCDRMVEFANDVGLFSEEIDPESGALLGNFPRPSPTWAS